MSARFRLGLLAAIAGAFQFALAGAQAPAGTASPAGPGNPAASAATAGVPEPVAAPAPPPPPSAPPGFTRIGIELKPTQGKIVDVEKGDNGCYLTVEDIKRREFIEVGGFELCTQKPPLKGKQVELEYRLESIMASSCYGNPKCTTKETVPFVVSVKVTQ
jgi:hypothetical protein